jgi:hypothetical protein
MGLLWLLIKNVKKKANDGIRGDGHLTGKDVEYS